MPAIPKPKGMKKAAPVKAVSILALRLPPDELTMLHELAAAGMRSGNNTMRSLIRQAHHEMVAVRPRR